MQRQRIWAIALLELLALIVSAEVFAGAFGGVGGLVEPFSGFFSDGSEQQSPQQQLAAPVQGHGFGSGADFASGFASAGSPSVDGGGGVCSSNDQGKARGGTRSCSASTRVNTHRNMGLAARFGIPTTIVSTRRPGGRTGEIFCESKLAVASAGLAAAVDDLFRQEEKDEEGEW